jgi:hypothetical protein
VIPKLFYVDSWYKNCVQEQISFNGKVCDCDCSDYLKLKYHFNKIQKPFRHGNVASANEFVKEVTIYLL